jgi:hypothetical protein
VVLCVAVVAGLMRLPQSVPLHQAVVADSSWGPLLNTGFGQVMLGTWRSVCQAMVASD